MRLLRCVSAVLLYSFITQPVDSAETPAKPPARLQTESGLSLYKNGDIAAAVKFYDKAIETDPNYHPAYAARAQAFHTLDNEAAMRRDIEKARLMDAKDYFSLTARGNLRLLEANTAEAIDDFNSAISANSYFADAYLGRGRAYRALGNLKASVEETAKALTLEPKMVIGLFNRGRALRSLGDTARATDDLMKAIKLNPGFGLPYVQMAEIFADHQEFERAILSYTRAIGVNPKYGFAYAARAWAYMQLGQVDAAMKDFDKAVELSPAEYWPYYERGEANWRMGNRSMAITDFKTALKARIDYTPAAAAMADRLGAERHTDEALEMYSKAIEAANLAPLNLRVPWLEKALLKRADYYEIAHQPKKAIQDINQAVDISSDSPTALIARANFYFHVNDEARAKQELEHVLGDYPAFAPAMLLKGKLLANQQMWKEALDSLDQALQSVPDLAEAYAARGLVYAYGLTEYDKSIADLNKAISLAPRHPEAYFNLGQVEIRRRNFRQALEAFNTALERKNATSATLRYLQARAQTYAALGQVASAMKDIQEALELDPKSPQLFTTLSALHLKSLDPEAALSDLEKAEELKSESYDKRMNAGLAFAMLGDYENAVKQFKKAISLFPRASDAQSSLCRTLRLAKDYRGALKACTKAIELTAKPGGMLFMERGFANFWYENYQEAVADFNEGAKQGVRLASAELARSAALAVLKKFQESDTAYRAATDLDPTVRALDIGFPGGKAPEVPNYTGFFSDKEKLFEAQRDPYVFLVRGNILNNDNKFESAVKTYTKALEIDAGIPAAFIDRCDALSAQQNFEAAERDCRRAVELSPDDEQANVRLILLLTLRRHYKEGLAATAAAVRRLPNSAALFVRGGNLRYFMKDLPNALENFNLAVAKNPNYADAYNGLGLCQYARREYADAIETFSRAISIDPRKDRYYRNRASTFAGIKNYPDAAADYKNALAVNTDPELVDEYKRLIESARHPSDPVSSELR